MQHNNYGRRDRRKKSGRLSTAAKILIAVVLTVYIIVMIVIGWIVFYKPSVSHEVPFNVPMTDAQGRPVEPKFEPVAGTYNFFVLGRDKQAYLTDVMMIINVNTGDNSITVMQLPRDTYIAGDYPTNKLNAVYTTIYHRVLGETGSEKEAGMKSLTEFTEIIEKSFCINIHYSAIMNLEGFKNIVDILGGVDVEVQFPLSYHDPYQGLDIEIPAGIQHLNGAAAEGFVRFRSGYAAADMGRQDAQKRFLFALFNKLKNSVKVSEVPRLTQMGNEIYNNLLTDIPAGDMVFFAKCLLDVDMSSIKMFTVPGSLPYNGFYVINKAGTIHAVNGYFNAYSTEITDYMFDQDQKFNDYSGAYDAPMENAEFGKVYGSGDEIYIIPAG